MTQQTVTRFDRGSWAALLYASFIFGLITIAHWVTWQLPSDGWVAQGIFPQDITLQANLLGLPSGLQPGDVLLEIDGRPVFDYARSAFLLPPPAGPGWQDGQVLQYTILRGNHKLIVNVPIRRFSPIEQIVGSFQSAVGVSSLAAAGLEIAASLIFFAVSLFTFLLRPRQRAAQALLIIGATFFYQHYYIVYSSLLLANPFLMRILAVFEGWIWGILPAFSYLTLAFPHPKWPVRRFPVMTVILLYGGSIAILLVPNLLFPTDLVQVLTWVRKFSMLPLIFLAIPVAAILHSLVTVRIPVERAQLKWITLGVLGFIGGGLAFSFGNLGRWTLALSLVQNGGYLMLPICIAIAVVRYRLFDIDVIIRRTLQYTSLTGLLGLVYFGSVVLGQRLVGSLTGEPDSTLVLVISTLLIAALFNPLRLKVQAFVDRRFYRNKYDALQTLAAFTQTARDESQLDTLVPALLGAVQDSLQPEQAWLWLRPQGGKQ